MGMVIASVCAVLMGGVGVGPSDSLLGLQSSFLDGATKLEVGGAIPGKVMAFGESSVVLSVSASGGSMSPSIVAGEGGGGRLAAMGHGAMLQPQASMVKLLKWLAGQSGKVGVFGGLPKGFESAGVSFASVRGGDIGDCGALILSPGDIGARVSAAELKGLLAKGKGLLMIDTPWGWLQLHPGQSLSKDHPGNAFLAEYGIGFADGYMDTPGGKMELSAPLPEHHARQALAVFEGSGQVKADLGRVVSDTLTGVLRDGRSDSAFVTSVKAAVKGRASSVYPVKGKPIAADDFRARLGMVYYDMEWRGLPAGKVVAHPAAKDFPGEVAQYEVPETAVVPIEAGRREWRSTGRYAAPGEKITVQLGAGLVGKKMSLRIGGQFDGLWHLDSWERFPSIDLEVPIVNGKAEAANPFGGMVYLVCREELAKDSAVITGSVAAPVFFLGRTSAADWKRIRWSGAPWGEIVGLRSAICVPASVLRDLEKPEEVAQYFDEMVMEAEKFYAVKPGTTEHRYQVDRQISAGYMHSGYPIMTWEDVSAKFVDIKILRGDDGNTNWGFYHELGHNYQRDQWTWSGWGETTNNLFSLYCCEHFNRQKGGHGAMDEKEVQKRLAKVKAKPGSEAFYDKDPWFGLTFWEMIRRDKGYGVFTEFFAWASDKDIRGEQAKKDAFLVEMSRITGHDLTKYGEMWGIKFSADAVAKAGKYPTWLPKELQ